MADSSLYWLDARFERAVVYYSCTSQKFWARIGHAVDPDCLNIDESKLAMRAARQIAIDTKAGPTSLVIVLQRLRRMMDDGKVKYEDVLAAGDLFLAAEEDTGLPSEDATAVELAPLLKRRIRVEVVDAVMKEAKSEGGELGETAFRKASELIEKEANLGRERVASPGVKVLRGSYELMESVKRVERFSTGIEDLDMMLKGGPRRGGFTLWLGGTGSGKSLSLIQRMGRAMRLGMHCALATLELSVDEQLARLKANLTNIATDDIMEEPRCVEAYLSSLPLGSAWIEAFDSGVTTAEDLFEWVDIIEREEGAHRGVERVPLDFLAVDYADLLGVPTKVSKDADSGYAVGKHVYGSLRIYAEGQKNTKANLGHPGGPIWVDTASAATRSKDKRKHLTTDDVADSIHKSRRATLVVSINPKEEGMTEFFVTKNSHGPAQFSVGPLPSDYATARIAPVIE